MPKFHAITVLSLSLAITSLTFMPDNPAQAERVDLSVFEGKDTPTPRAADSSLSGQIKRASEAKPKFADAVDGYAPPEILDFDEIRVVQEEIDLPLNWTRLDVRNGSTLSGLFNKVGLSDSDMLQVISGKGESEEIERIFPGEEIVFGLNDSGGLEVIELHRSPLELLRIENTGDGYIGQMQTETPDTSLAFATAKIDGSLYLAAKRAGMSDKLTMGIASIFAWDIDFVYDIRKGDSFEVLYEELFIDGKKVGTGDILAARFKNRDREVFAIRHQVEGERAAYYTPEGKSLEKAFLRTPINARISSSFNLQRRHPVLDYVRPHEGTDYAAPVGTPIKASGAGRVEFSGWKGGYGRTVILKHGDGITTLYAHMSEIDKSIRRGKRVEQGSTLGGLGSSGMVTGPHLHYEFRVNGSPRNSRTVDLPDGKPIPKSEMASFQRKVESLSADIAMLSKEDSAKMLSKAGD